jgi:hypothetical protein
MAEKRQRNMPEAVAVFDDADSLYAAIDELQMHGFNREELSLLAGEDTVEEKLGTTFWRAQDLEDEPDAPRIPYFSEESIGAAEGALIGIPAYVAAVATAGALVTPAGSMLTAIAGAVVAGGAGAGIGALLAKLVGDRHAQHLQDQIERGGLLLWVRTPDEEHQKKATEILERCGGRDVHVHHWTVPE